MSFSSDSPRAAENLFLKEASLRLQLRQLARQWRENSRPQVKCGLKVFDVGQTFR
jgi:hypothetical protein